MHHLDLSHMEQNPQIKLNHEYDPMSSHIPIYSQTLKHNSINNPQNLYDTIAKNHKQKQYWTKEEDTELLTLVRWLGDRKWVEVSSKLPNRTAMQCMQRYKKSLRPGMVKGCWSYEEDCLLLEIIDAHLKKNLPISELDWKETSLQIRGRNPKQCRERWFLNLDPNINRNPWTPEEDRLLFQLAEKYRMSWSRIARFMPGRTNNSVKIRYHSIMRKQSKNRIWSDSERQELIEHALLNNFQWTTIATKFLGRTVRQVREEFYHIAATKPEWIENQRYLLSVDNTNNYETNIANQNAPNIRHNDTEQHLKKSGDDVGSPMHTFLQAHNSPTPAIKHHNK